MDSGTPKVTYKIPANSYHSDIEWVGSDYIYMNRHQKYTSTGLQVDVYGPVWLLGFANIPKNILSIRSASQQIPLEGLCGFFAPSYSLLKWQFQPGSFQWAAALSLRALPDNFYNKAFIFDWDGTRPSTYEAIINVAQNSLNKVFIEEQAYSSNMAEKTKKYMDANFRLPMTIEQICTELKFSWAFMTREFRKVYGLSPVEYRHKVRLFNAIYLLSKGFSVTNACLDSGFSSISQFNIQFKRFFGTQPINYSPQKNPTKLLISL